MLKSACISAAQVAGLTVKEVCVSDTRAACPECGHEHAAAPVNSHGTWECLSCGMKRHSDQIDVLHMLKEAGAPDAVEKAKVRRHNVSRQIASVAAPRKRADALAECKSAKGNEYSGGNVLVKAGDADVKRTARNSCRKRA